MEHINLTLCEYIRIDLSSEATSKFIFFSFIFYEFCILKKDIDISQVLPTQVPPRGGSCIWGPTS
ncbi:LOW QUALITY PROTEIN: hypothetical protein V1478_014805 [Vespula squamosa]|uniref:Uncharacterized protein n=1 Tax=Vespula squamosa TaxID=30214 RepID=A0ABD2A3Q2_VESSQ